jgi:hypothetical protein
MGRGLSDLQRWILRQAAAVPAEEVKSSPLHPVAPGTMRAGRLYYRDILLGYYRWEPAGAGKLGLGQNMFCPRRIGPRRYRSTMAALSRAPLARAWPGHLPEGGVLPLGSGRNHGRGASVAIG